MLNKPSKYDSCAGIIQSNLGSAFEIVKKVADNLDNLEALEASGTGYIRYHDANKTYKLNDLVGYQGKIYRALGGVYAGPFNASSWEDISGSVETGTGGTYNNSVLYAGGRVPSQIIVENGIVTGISTRILTPENIGAATIDHTHPTGDHDHGSYNNSESYLGGTVPSQINVTNGIVTGIVTRDLTPASLGAAAAVHDHSAYNNSGNYLGGTVIDAINVSKGIVHGISTRELLPGSIGAAAVNHTHAIYNNEAVYLGGTVPDLIRVNNGIVTNIRTRNLTPASIGAAAATHTHSTYNNLALYTGATVPYQISVYDGIVTGISTRELTPASIGAAAADHTHTTGDHTHSTFDNVVTYSGGTVPSQISVTDGIVTGITTRELTPASIGAAAGDHNHGGLTNSTTHSGSTVISRVSTTAGIVTSMAARNLSAADVGATPNASTLSYVSTFNDNDRFPIRTSTGLDRYSTWSRIKSLVAGHLVDQSIIWSTIQYFNSGIRIGESGTVLKSKVITGTTNSSAGNVYLSHGVTQSKIVSFTVYVNSVNIYYVPNHGGPTNTKYYEVEMGSASLVIKTTAAGSSMYSKPVKALIWYTN